MRRLFISLLLSAILIPVLAQESLADKLPGCCERLSVSGIGIGNLGVLDEYMSPNVYRGPVMSLAFQRQRMMRKRDDWGRTSFLKIGFSPMKDRNGKGGYMSLIFDWHHSWDYICVRRGDFFLSAGPETFLKAGGILNLSNSNNPAQLKLYAAAAVSGNVSYRFLISNYPITLDWKADLPLIGYNFAPTFGLQYYEIGYLGKFGEASHLAWPGNLFDLSQRVSVDLPVGEVMLRLSYLGDYYRYNMGNVRCRMYENSFMIGIIRRLEIKYNGR